MTDRRLSAQSEIVSRTLFAAAALILGALAGCEREVTTPASQPATGGGAPAARTIQIGLVAKSNNNAVFQAARRGGEAAATELGKKWGVKVEVLWRTPDAENAQEQANNIEALTRAGVQGISISCSDASMVTKSIDDAVARGIPVMCFDSDAAESKRFCFHGVDDIALGRMVMMELGQVMGGKGNVAILAGNPSAPNLIRRVQAVKDCVAEKFPEIKIVGVFNHEETAAASMNKVEAVMRANPEITGWAMIGGWPLFSDKDLPWEAGKVRCVAVDALRSQLRFLRNGQADVLLAQQVFRWGHRSVEILLAKALGKTDVLPAALQDYSEPIRVSRENVDEFEKRLDAWGM